MPVPRTRASRLACLLIALLAVPGLATARAARRPVHRPAALWERITVTRVLPSAVFARLGLTHMTRRGYTRDGAKKTDPDPTFPPGLTDIVPYDHEHVLLVRGTAPGLAAFRAQVVLAEAQAVAPRWHIQAELLRTANGEAVALDAPWQGDAADNAPTLVTFEASGTRTYQVAVRPGAAPLIAWQRGLVLPPVIAAVGVPSPAIAWSPAQTRPYVPGMAVTFEDLAADRPAAPDAPPTTPPAADYEIKITVTPLAPPPIAAPALPAAPDALPLPPPPASGGALE